MFRDNLCVWNAAARFNLAVFRFIGKFIFEDIYGGNGIVSQLLYNYTKEKKKLSGNYNNLNKRRYSK